MEWASHLLRYKDGRFGMHPRFRYVAFNMHYRRTANRQARYATKKYNATFTLGWRANTDINPCTSSHAVIQYVAKYASKAEKQSRSHAEIFNSVVGTVTPGEARHPLLTTATKMLNSLVVERDWSAQEISHILLGYPLVSSSRGFETLDLRTREQGTMAITIEEGAVRQAGLSMLDKYLKRHGYKYEGREDLGADTTGIRQALGSSRRYLEEKRSSRREGRDGLSSV